MILDRAANLRSLAEQARAAADLEHQDAALVAVQEVLTQAGDAIAAFGVGAEPWRAQLDAPARAAVAAAAGELAAAVAPLRDLTDDQLAAYARSPERGRLRQVVAGGASLRTALEEAHAALLESWRERIWPAERRAELGVLAHLPEHAAAARTVERTLERLGVAVRTRTGTADLEQLAAETERAEQAARGLARDAVPPEVLALWRAVGEAGEAGLPLSDLSPAVHAWLLEHGAATRFALVERP